MVQLNEDEYTEYCFDEAIAYAYALATKPQLSEDGDGTKGYSKNKEGGKPKNALSFMTNEKFRAK